MLWNALSCLFISLWWPQCRLQGHISKFLNYNAISGRDHSTISPPYYKYFSEIVSKMRHFCMDIWINKELHRAYGELWCKNLINAWVITLRIIYNLLMVLRKSSLRQLSIWSAKRGNSSNYSCNPFLWCLFFELWKNEKVVKL